MSIALDGVTDLPPGTIAAVVTYLEMRAQPCQPTASAHSSWALDPIERDLARYRDLYAKVGEQWLWFSRAVSSDDRLRPIIEHPAVEVFALRDGARDVGLLELDFRQAGECELAFFGLIADAIGKGAGRFMMGEAIRLAWSKPIERFFVHTCTLDHPSAVPFYLRSGFRPYKRAIEIAPDPRLTGFLPLDAAMHIPALAGEVPPAKPPEGQGQ